MDVFDVIIVGGGPAGSAVATLVTSTGRRVLVVEKSRFPREKLCGEFISPECAPILQRLGVFDRVVKAGARPIGRMDLVAPDGRKIEVPVSWFTGSGSVAFGLSRARLDAILLDRAREAGAIVNEGFHVTTIDRREGRFEVEGRFEGGSKSRYAARLIVDASGRGEMFAPRERRLSETLQTRGHRLFACKIHLRGAEGLDGFGELYFFRGGYGGLSEVEPDEIGPRSNLCFLTTESTLNAAKGDRQHLLDLTVLSNPAARARLSNAVPVDGWLGAGPIVYGQRPRVPGVIAVGDARAFIDPFTGSGILLALSGAELAARAIKSVDEAREIPADLVPELVESRYRELYRASIGRRFRASEMLRRLAFTPFSRRLLVPLLARNQGLTRLLALSTRPKRVEEVTRSQII
ncbi:MAG: NAD(P)/FAD-dependent oxidoreductase [Acidobacteriota bacterium]